MNRPIKFRGYAVEEMVGSQWLYGTGINQIESSEEYAKEIGKKHQYYLFTESGWIEVYGESIGQYAGLKDKNGTEIYEGDIVEYKDFSGGAYLFGKQPLDRDVVKWNKDTGGYKVRGQGYTFNTKKMEVIGNIHQNPELLEESE
ncbi:hypothetical protein F9U64_01290 [Gracilibacillus oryzae]|uniref:YopX protein domain-containing protein n=1 Tax=Gracilibacillus oryzae TaxID=1672701 RepID=A0A7C8GVX2_9BACI|nr:YopX family protein [Gracilibacillus oryzae]KAB8139287.1 hypothetical protein F9U64_01290 [Gracilibacillus oryzae]